jgi:tetratricopeptide (TPR) repeat protein
VARRSLVYVVFLGTVVACGSGQPQAPVLTSAPQPATLPSPAVPPPPPSVTAIAKGALLLDGLGAYRKPVTVAFGEATQYFDQGLRLTYAFNHDEAARSYARAAELDPSCAMCFWGTALVLGPNYNVPMLPERSRAAWEALERARALAPRTTEVEQALIGALAHRYKGPEPLDAKAMQPFTVAYADAMRDVADRFPDDVDVQVLAAEARMDVNPWKLWSLDGKPAPGTEEIVGRLERVLARVPTHVGANHYYIHAVEASSHPEKALPSAERLSALMPGAGHTVHMPAHIFQRVGRYADASAANAKAADVDVAYIELAKPTGYYPMYLGHNYGFLSFSASMEGRSATSLSAARDAAKALPPAMIDMMPGMDFFIAEPLLAMVRFGRWDELLAEPRPESKYLVLSAFWLHGHGMALAAKGKLKDARREHDELVALRGMTPPDLMANQSKATDVVAVAAKVLEARIATLEKKPNALALWAEAVQLKDRLAYAEPDDWFYPVRHYQGAALLGAGKPVEAEAVYRDDLRQHPKNGWALYGVWQSLAAQKKPAREVSAAKAAFDAAWALADFPLKTTAP